MRSVLNGWVCIAEFPANCSKFFGPNDISCYSTIFAEVQCVAQGYKEPKKLSAVEVDKLDSMNLWNILDLMNNSRNAADNNSLQEQLSCFGMSNMLLNIV